MIYMLTDDPNLFPDPYEGEPDGLIAIGGDLSPQRLLTAYSNGIFPWYGHRESPEPMWWCPLQRFVIFPDEIHISHSMRTLINKRRYRITYNTAFAEVLDNCASGTIGERQGQPGAWLGDDMKAAYTRLYDMGCAASVEVWDGDTLVGGLYGVTDGRSFFGESMFSKVPSGSKLALIALAQRMVAEKWGGLIDCQFETPHLKSMGGRYINYDRYMDILTGAEDAKEDIEKK